VLSAFSSETEGLCWQTTYPNVGAEKVFGNGTPRHASSRESSVLQRGPLHGRPTLVKLYLLHCELLQKTTRRIHVVYTSSFTSHTQTVVRYVYEKASIIYPNHERDSLSVHLYGRMLIVTFWQGYIRDNIADLTAFSEKSFFW